MVLPCRSEVKKQCTGSDLEGWMVFFIWWYRVGVFINALAGGSEDGGVVFFRSGCIVEGGFFYFGLVCFFDWWFGVMRFIKVEVLSRLWGLCGGNPG